MSSPSRRKIGQIRSAADSVDLAHQRAQRRASGAAVAAGRVAGGHGSGSWSYRRAREFSPVPPAIRGAGQARAKPASSWGARRRAGTRTGRRTGTDVTSTLFQFIDLRSFSDIWYWLMLGLVWTRVMHAPMGVPAELVHRARRGQSDAASRPRRADRPARPERARRRPLARGVARGGVELRAEHARHRRLRLLRRNRPGRLPADGAL